MRLAALPLCLLALPVVAQPVRIATWDPGLTRDGPGLLLRDIRDGDPQVSAAVRVIAGVAPDAILLTGIDWDHDGQTITAFADLLAAAGHAMPHQFAAMPNSGVASGIDLNGDGRMGTADDAHGFGRFTGEDGMALLSRLPITAATDYSAALWRDLPDGLMPPETSSEVAAVQRLSSTAHWDIRIQTDDGPLHILGWSAAPPAFDGPDGRNVRRNHDEAAFWLSYLPQGPFVLAGKINIDAFDGDGITGALDGLLEHVTDTAPRGEWQPPQNGVNAEHRGDPALDTAEFRDTGPGNLRVDYVLPSKDLRVVDSGVFWPAPDNAAGADAVTASNHRLVWVEIDLQP